MYNVTVRNRNGTIKSGCRLMAPPNLNEESEILLGFPEGYFIDICYIPPDTISDTANFRDSVEADLEPFSLDPFIEEIS